MYELEVAARWAIEFIKGRTIWLFLILLAAGALLLRYVHVLNADRNYLLGPDSHFFHWLAGRIMAGEGPPPDMPTEAIYTIHTGLAYPIAYIAKAVSSIFEVTSGDALHIASKLLPPVLGIISLVIIYIVAARIYDRKTGCFAALSWALMLHSVFLGASGLIDRDGLITLSIMMGALLFYFSNEWHLKIGGRDIGWIITGLGVFWIEGLLYLEWSFVGSGLLLALIIFYFIVSFVLKFIAIAKLKLGIKERLLHALNDVGWRAFGVIILINIIVLIAFYPQASSWFGSIRALIGFGGKLPVQELQRIGLRDLTVYHLFLIPMVVGLYVTWKKRSRTSIFFACWFLFYLILSVFSRRILIFAAPAACLLSGVGLMYMWDWTKTAQVVRSRRVVVIIFILLVFLVSFITAASIGIDPVMSVDKEWQYAMTYLSEETPQDSFVMSNWSWGYWILDMGQRRPLVDNGYYGYPQDILKDIGLVYTTAKPSEAVQVMEKYGADYIVFSKLDDKVAASILGWAGLGEKYGTFPEDSLVARSLSGEFEAEDGLEVVYRTLPDSEVVILGLAQSWQP